MIHHPSLHGRRILLGVTGGIAAYKAAELTRRLLEAGAEVQVAMTAGAQRFVAPLTFQALSGKPVRTSLWDAHAEAAMGHIELARWPDLILIAPASADFLARLAHGNASDLLSTLCLATDRPIAVAPAMNRLMWANAATADNLTVLQRRGIEVLGPGVGDQACGEVGPGRMLEPGDLVGALAERLGGGPLSGHHAVVTSGPTREPIDPVRVLTNRSSGKMGFAVAAQLATLGARVTLVAGPVALPTPAGVQRIDVESARQMLDAARKAMRSADIFVGAAAVADYRPAQTRVQKIKKRSATLALDLERTEDVLATIRREHPDAFVVGFAAETEKLDEHARAKLDEKKLDLLAANLVGHGRAFDRDDNALHAYWPGGDEPLGHGTKSALARQLAELIAARCTNPKRQTFGT